MAPMNRLWGALGVAGWGPRAPRDAPEHKLQKIKKNSLFWTPKLMPFWYIFHRNRGVDDGSEIVEKNKGELYDFLKKTRPEYMPLQNITQVKKLKLRRNETLGRRWSR